MTERPKLAVDLNLVTSCQGQTFLWIVQMYFQSPLGTMFPLNGAAAKPCFCKTVRNDAFCSNVGSMDVRIV